MPKQTKSETEPPSAAAKPDAGAVLNKAKAAFDQHRKRTTGARSRPTTEFRHGPIPGLPPGVAGPAFPMPPWGAPTVPGAGTAWPGISWPTGAPGPVSGLAGAAPPFAEGVGQMLRMGVAFATAALAGGLQVVQGFAGQMGGAFPGPMAYSPGGSCCQTQCGCGCADECCCDCGCDCACCGRHGGCDCCQVGVHNCRCCG